MLFSPWLSTFRHKARRQTASSRRLLSRRDERHLFPLATEVLETRTLLTGPTFVSVSPNVGDFLQDGDVRTEVPQELEFQFSLADSIDPLTLGAIQVIGAGHDGAFTPASTVTDFGTSGGVVVRIGAGSVGAEQNGSTLTILNVDNNGNGPTVGISAARNEIQQLSLPSAITSGTFQLTFSGNTTADIAFDADAATVQAELNALANINPGDVIVTGGPLPGSTMTFEFRGQYARTNVPTLVLNNAGLTNNEIQTVTLPGNPTAGNFTLRLNDVANSIVGNSLAIDFDSLARNERQFVSTTGVPTGGTFTLDFNDAGSGIMGTSNNINFNANAAAVQAAIEGGIPALTGNISVTAGPLPGAVEIQFIGTLAATNVAPFVLNNNSLTGGTTPSVTIRQSNSVLTALENIAGLAGNLQITGTALPNTLTVEFINGLADTNVAAFTVNSNTLSGGTSTAVTLATQSNGNQIGSVTTTQTSSNGGLTLTLDNDMANLMANATTVDDLLDFIANDAVASQVLSAEVLSGDTTLDISGAALFRTLSGAGAASVISDLQTGTDLRVQITADVAGLDGNRIFVQLNRQDLGTASSVPQVTVSGSRIEVVLNDDPTMTAQTTAQDLVDALNAAAGTLITASVAIGSGATIVSDVQDGTVLQLSGADTLINAGYRDVTGSSSQVIYRFAETLPDDLYRIEVRGRGATPLRDTDGEAFGDGLDDHFQQFTINLGSQVRSVVPQPVLRQQILTINDVAGLSDGDTITIDPGQLSATPGQLFVFELTDLDVDASDTVRPGNLPVIFSSAGDTEADVAMKIRDAINAATLASIDVDAGWLMTNDFLTITGGAFDARVTVNAQNAAAFSLEAGGLTQRRNLVNVTLSDDELDAALATDPRFYRLFDSNETLVLEDDTLLLPSNVYYSAADNTAVLDFDSPIPFATYRLLIGTSNEPNDLLAEAVNVGNVFATQDFSFTRVGYIGDANGDVDVDLYRVLVTPGDTITVTVDPEAGLDSTIRLFDSTGAELDLDNTGAAGNQDQLVFATSAMSDGEFYVGISNATNNAYDPTDGSGTIATGTSGSYQLSISSSTAISTDDDNSSFATSTQLGTLGDGTISFFSQIEDQSIVLPAQTGDGTEPGHREIPVQTHINGSTLTDVVRYSFPVIYGKDSGGTDLINQISPAQEDRAREIFERYAALYGFEVEEVTTTNVTSSATDIIHVVTGDVRVLLPAGANPSSVAGIAGTDAGGKRITIMNALQNFTAADDLFGANWMDIAIYELGHAIGLGHSYELRAAQGDPIFGTGLLGDGTNPFGEDYFPSSEDITNGLVIHPNTSTDIDLYQFSVDTTGTLSAEIVAERFDGSAAYLSKPSSLLNSALQLYRQNLDGTRTLLAQNDDYFSNDAFINLELEAGTYFIGVSSTGNTDYDPRFSDSGFNGTSKGDYQLNLTFATARAGSLLDTTGERFDGNADGEAGGTFEFDFRSGNTLLVDKSIVTNLQLGITAADTILRVDDVSVFPETIGFQIQIDNEIMTVTNINTVQNRFTVMRAQNATTAVAHAINSPIRPELEDGSEANPFGIIKAAVAFASPGDIIRIVGNGGADNDILTIDDNRPYLIGLDDSLVALEDGSKLEIPKDVVVQIDSGAIIKAQSANIADAGTSALGIDRSGSALQVLGTPYQAVYLTTYENDLIGGDSDGVTDGANAGDWGGLVLRADSDFQASDAAAKPRAPGIFLNYINQADISYGGGKVTVDSVQSVYAPVHLISARPTVTYNTVTNSAAAAMSANPDSFDESRGRIGPDLTGNTITGNTFNGIFVRIVTPLGQPIDQLTVGARFDDTDIVHIITENLEIVGNPGGPLDGAPRLSGRLAIDPGVVVKMGGSRIEALRGNSSLIAEGTSANPVIITSIFDDSYGAAGSFDSTGNGQAVVAAPGDWGGLIFNATSRASIADALIAYGGGEIPIEGGFGTFNVIELHQGVKARIADSTIENNAAGGGDDRNGRGATTQTTIFVRQAQPILLNNIIRNNDATPIDINANSLIATIQRDTGRSTGALQDYPEYADNNGPLIRLNRIDGNLFNGLEVRAEILSTESVWDDTDIVHVVRDEIVVDQHHTYSGLRLQSSVDESLVVKFEGPTAGITADGFYQDIDDRIGGTVQIIGRPDHPVVLTALKDSSVGAGLTPEGIEQLYTDPSTRPTGQPTTAIVDVVLLLNDTLSFQNVGPTVQSVFPQIVAALQAALPGADLAFGVSRFEEYSASSGFGNAPELRPFILNQPVITTTTPQFDQAISAALARNTPGGGSGDDESQIEALFQIATGIGFDHNNNGSVLDSGAAGLFTTQTAPGNSGDVPDFASFMADLLGDPNGPILPSSGTIGGVGFRPTATERIVLLANDDAFEYEDDALTFYTGVGGVTVPKSIFEVGTPFNGGVHTTTTPGGRGAQFQPTIDALIANGIKVVGLGAITTPNVNPQPQMEGLAVLTGAVDALGNPLYFNVDPDNAGEVADAIVSAVTGAVTTVSAGPGDWRGLRFTGESNDRNVRVELENELAANRGVEANNTTANAQFLGELAPEHITGPNASDLSAVDTIARSDGDDNRPEGFEIHGFISMDSTGDVDIYSFNATAGNEIWIDLDRTRGGALDPVVELIQADGTLIARTRFDHATQMVDFVSGTATPTPLTENAGLGGDFYSTNPYDTGFRIVLPGPASTLQTYFVRVRSNQATNADLDDDAKIDQGTSGGEYQLQIRTQQVDEKPGSTVRYADIRLASTAIEVIGLPAHSPLMGESIETTADNNSTAEAQQLGNLLESDRTVFSTGGTLATATDRDFYQFNIDYAELDLNRDGVDETPSIQSVSGLSAPAGATWSTVFDVDYADGLTRGDTTLIVYDGNGVPILIGRESDIEDDRTFSAMSNDLDDLSRGSVGYLDPFIGPVQLPTGGTTSTTNYYYAVSSNSQLNRQLNQTYLSTATNADVRLEPVTSVTRIIEDHIGFQGYSSYGATVDPSETDGLFNIGSTTELSATVREFDLADVPLFITRGNQLFAYDVVNGQVIQTISSDLGTAGDNIQDLVMRSDGTLYGYQEDGATPTGKLVTVNSTNGTLAVVGADGVGGGGVADIGALTFGRSFDTMLNATVWTGYYSVFANLNGVTGINPADDGLRQTRLYTFNSATGVVTGSVPIQVAGLVQATTNITITESTAATAVIQLTAVKLGTFGNGVTVNTTSVAPGTGVAVNVSGTTINIDVPTDTTAQDVIVSLMGNAAASALVTPSLISGSLGTVADVAVAPANSMTSGGTGTPVLGNVTGLAFNDFTGGTLYGVTNRGEVLTIDPGTGEAVVVHDFNATPLGLTNAEFRGLTLGPQNLHDGVFAHTLFAINNAGEAIAFRGNGPGSIVPVTAFGSDNAIQAIMLSGAPTVGDTFTLSVDTALYGTVTTDPINANSGTLEDDIIAALVALRPVNRLGQRLDGTGGTNDVPIFEAGDLSYTGTIGGTDFEITFGGFYRDKPVSLITVDNTGMAAEMFTATTVATGGDGVRTSAVKTGLPTNATGLAFSNLDFNLWHPTTTRSANDGHGVPDSFDQTRDPANEMQGIVDGRGIVRTQNELQGGTSFYFGLENYQASGTTSYLNYEGAQTQFGIEDNEFQRDLTSSGAIGGNYNLPGGALGTLVTQPFDLISDTGDQSLHDRPTLYFNYFLDTERDEADDPNDPNGTFNDSARVFISTDGGRSWSLVATNNTPRDNNSELPYFSSHSAQANTGDARQEVQELFDATDWRQVRVDLSDYVGMSGVQLRFDFSTAGTIVQGGFSTNDSDLATSVDNFGRLQNTVDGGGNPSYTRALDNQHEGFYIDDIIIGWSERGEMITGATADEAYFQVPQPPAALMLPVENLTGDYQVEVRRGFEYAATPGPTSTDVVIQNTFDSNVRYIPGTTAASVSTAYGTSGPGEVIVTYSSQVLGSDGAGIDIIVQTADLGMSTLPMVSVNGAMTQITVTLNSFAGSESTAQDLVDAINNDGAASLLIVASLTGDGAADLGGMLPGARTVTTARPQTVADTDTPGLDGNTRGDRNVERQQGVFLIENNIIRDVAVTAIDVTAAPRALIGGLSTMGSPINFDQNNAQQLAPGVVIANNLITGFGTTGIHFSGDANWAGTDTLPATAVPFGKIINNTIFGADSQAYSTALQNGTGILIDINASPTLLNNIIAHTTLGIDNQVSGAGASVGPVINRTFFHDNTADGATGQNAIFDAATNPLFINVGRRNFYLADGAQAVDRSLGSLPDRTLYVAVKGQSGIPNSDVVSPDLDLFGQKRVDDPTQVPSGLGGEVFNDLGAIERADFEGGVAILIVPLDGGPDDLSTVANDVHIDNPSFFNQIVIELYDDGIGIDDATVATNGSQFSITETTHDGTRTLQKDIDYTFVYHSNSNRAIFTSLTTFDLTARYHITVDNSLATGILDFALNPLVQNQMNGTVAFDILATDGVNDPPINMLPALQTVDENDTAQGFPTSLTFSTANGNSITFGDPDAFLGTNELEVTLTVSMFSGGDDGSLTLPIGFASMVTLNMMSDDGMFTADGGLDGMVDGIGDTTIIITGTIPNLNAVLDGLVFTPTELYDGLTPTSTDDAEITVRTSDLGNFNLLTSPAEIATDVITIDIIPAITPLNSFDVAPSATPIEVTEDGTTQTGSFTVVLDRIPLAGTVVVLDVVVGDTGEVTISDDGGTTTGTTLSLTFDESNWDMPQTVTVIGVDDNFDDGDIDSLVTVSVNTGTTTDRRFNEAGRAPDQTVDVRTLDDDTAGFTLSTMALTVTEAAGAMHSGTFTVVLDASPFPGEQVVIDLSVANGAYGAEATLSTTRLTFTSANWDMAQTVTVTAVDDDFDDGNMTVPLTLTVNDGLTDQVEFDNLADQTVMVTTVDDDVAGFTVSAMSLTVTEAAGAMHSATFTVVLDASPLPGEQVVLDLSLADGTYGAEATLSLTSLTFDEFNWDTARTITVTAVDDAFDDGDMIDLPLTITVNDAMTDQAEFDALADQTVLVTTIDNDIAGFTLSRTTLSVTEAAGASHTGTFTVVLVASPLPGEQVVIDLSLADGAYGADATIDKTTLTFTPANWNMAETITVTAIDDNYDDGNMTLPLTISVNDAMTDQAEFDNLADQTVMVTTVDNDVAGFTRSPAGPFMVSEDGTVTASFDVQLTAEPLPGEQVVLSLTLSDGTEVSIDKSSLTFDGTNLWNTPQTVTITGVDDNYDDGNILSTITVAVNDALTDQASFDAVADQIVSVTTTDDDAAGFTLSSTGTFVVSEDGTVTATFTVELTAEPFPGEQVVLNITPSDAGEVAVDLSSLTFDGTNLWNAPQTVTISGVDDNFVDGDIDSIITVSVNDAATNQVQFDNLADQTIDVTTTDNDVAGFTLTPSGPLMVSEDGTTTTAFFDVELTAEPLPGQQVVLDITLSDGSEVAVDVSRLTFNAGSPWNVPQRISVTGVNDNFDDGDIMSTITVAVNDSLTNQPEFDVLPDQVIDVTTIDDDTAGVSINVLNGVSVAESGTTDTFVISLDAQPLPGTLVVVTFSSGDLGEATVAPASYTFNSTNWTLSRTVTVTGVDDRFDDGDIVSQVTVAIDDMLTTDPAFSMTIADQTVDVTTTDDDEANFTIDLLGAPGGVLSVSEDGTQTDTFTVVLNARPIPGTQVVISVTPNDSTEVGAIASLTFDSSNWSMPQTVTVTGVDDVFDDGDISSTLTVAIDTMNTDAPAFLNPNQGAAPAAVANQTVNVTTLDNDTAGFTIDRLGAPGGVLTVSEDGAQTDTFTIVLNARPQSGTVVLTIVPTDATEGATMSSPVTFDTNDWNTPKTVTISGVDDIDVDGDITTAFTVSVSSATDTAFLDLMKAPPQNVAFTNLDDEVAEFDIVESGGNSIVSETGTTDTFTVVLRDRPLSNVTISVTSTDTGEVSVNKSTLTFTPMTWNIPQTVTVTGVDEFTVDGTQIIPVRLAIVPASSHPLFHSLPAKNVNVSVTDNDVPSFSVTEPIDGTFPVTTVSESRTSDTLAVVLGAQPETDVVLTVMISDPTEASLNTAQLRFTFNNWNIPQQIVVTGVDDAVVDGPQISILTVAVNAALTNDFFDGLAPQMFNVTTLDNDFGRFLVSTPSTTTVSEDGTSATFLVVLQDQPLTDVVLDVVSSDTTETSVDKSTLTFTPMTWNLPQTVTVTGVDDSIIDGTRLSTITVSVNDAASDDEFDGALPSTRTFSTTDNDVAGFTVTESGGSTSVDESGTSDTFTVVLDAAPASDVVFTVTASNTDEATVDLGTLTFTSMNWFMPQTVTVTGADDEVVDGTVVSSVTVSVNDGVSNVAFRELADATVSVATTDDDVAGFTIVESSGSSEVSESGLTDSFTVVLNAKPLSDVVLTVVSSDADSLSASPASLTFTPGDWDTPQTVDLLGLDDGIVNGDRNIDVTISVDVPSSDAGFSSVGNQVVSVLLTDDDVAGFVITSPIGGLEVIETGTTDTFTVALTAKPLTDVVLDISSSDAGEATADVSQLTFTPDNWSTPQTVTVTGVDDTDDDGDQVSQISVSVNIAGSDSLFAAVGTAMTPVTTYDDEGIVLTVTLQGATGLIVGADGSGDVLITLTGDALATLEGTVNGIPVSGPFPASEISRLIVTGSGEANDIDLSGVTSTDFTFVTGLSTNVNSGSGDDVIVGSEFGDFIVGAGGDDVIDGGDGDDTIFGGAGKDALNGGAGNDSLNGQGGTGDSLTGGAGDDFLDGGAGNDIIVEFITGNLTLTNTTMTGLGNDIVAGVERARLTGGGAANMIDASAFFTPGFTSVSLYGGGGNDELIGSPGNDVLSGQSGNDRVLGGGGADRVFGGSGADTLDGQDGDDMVFGQGGSGDWLTGGAGDDLLNGGSGVDRVVASGDVDWVLTNSSLDGDGSDTLVSIESASLTGGPSDNVIDASAFSLSFVILSGGAGNDTLIGGNTLNTLNGRDGDDVLIGGPKNDKLRGNNGNDLIEGGDGDDLLEGGDGDDTLLGQGGDDTIDGGRGADGISGAAGNDVLQGWKGADLVLGGTGNDTLQGDDGDDTLIGGVGADNLAGQIGVDVLVRGNGTDPAEPGDVVDNLSEVDDLFMLMPFPSWIDEI